MKQLAVAIVYLLLAEALEFAILVQIHPMDGWLAALLDLRMLAMAGILWGFWRGELQGMGMALGAALLFGLSQSAGQLGASVVSFTLVAFLAGMLARGLRPRSAFTVGFFLFALLALERIAWCGVRWGLGVSKVFEIQWSGLLLTALGGALLYALLSPICRIDLRQGE